MFPVFNSHFQGVPWTDLSPSAVTSATAGLRPCLWPVSSTRYRGLRFWDLAFPFHHKMSYMNHQCCQRLEWSSSIVKSHIYQYLVQIREPSSLQASSVDHRKLFESAAAWRLTNILTIEVKVIPWRIFKICDRLGWTQQHQLVQCNQLFEACLSSS